jgi:hypothetical protein
VIASVGPAIDDSQHDLSAVLEIGHANDRAERQRAMRGHHLPLVESFAIGGALTVEPGTVK